MATGHLNPGYKQSVSKFYDIEHSKDNHQNSLTCEIANRRWLLNQPNVSSDVLENIRREAREKWLSLERIDSDSQTSYMGNYQFRKLDEPVHVRPASPTRRNNPHPSVIFLRCRLHQLPGFHELPSRPRTTLTGSRSQSSFLEYSKTMPLITGGNYSEIEKNELNQSVEKSTATYRGDSSCSSRPTFAERPQTTAALSTVSTHPNFLQTTPQTLSTSSTTSSSHSRSSTTKPSSISSINRSRSRQQSAISIGCRPKTGFVMATTGSRRSISVDNISLKDSCLNKSNLIYQKNQYPRQDYSIHYQWPVTLPQHKLY